MTDLAWAVLIGLAFYGVVNLVGDVIDFFERRRRAEQLASIHDFAEYRRNVRPTRRAR